MKCFRCGKEGHLIRARPGCGSPAASGAVAAAAVATERPAPV